MNSDQQKSGHDFITPENTPIKRVEAENMTVSQLRTKLKSLNLPVYGCKQTLCQRLLTTTRSDASSQDNFSQNGFTLFEKPLETSYDVMNSSSSSIAKYRLVDLRKKCKSAGLPSSGRKQELIDRLELYYEKALLNDILDSKEIDGEGEGWSLSNRNIFFNQLPNSQPQSNWEVINFDPLLVKDEEQLSKFNKSTLQALCRNFGLKVSGLKLEIVERVWSHIVRLRSSLYLAESTTSEQHNDQNFYEHRRKRFKTSRLTGSTALKARQRSSTQLFENNQFSISPNQYLDKAMKRRFYVFASSISSSQFQCEILCEDEHHVSPHTITISNKMTCTCHECSRYQLCHHVLFVLMNILGAGKESSVLTKTTLREEELESVLRDIKLNIRLVQGTKPALKKCFFTRANVLNGGDPGSVEVIRQKWDGKLCGVCFQEFTSTASMIWCRSQCGKNMHVTCYDRWLEQQETDEHRCPFCSVAWGRLPKNTRFQSNLKRSRIA